MPTSHWKSISTILDIMISLQPRPLSVLDVGIGYGKYGLLAREYLTYWGKRYDPGPPARVKIDGIEAFPDYVTELQRLIYDRIYLGDAIDVLPALTAGEYDLVLMIDVLEHFSWDHGKVILDECQRVGTTTIVSTPINLEPQGDAFGNPYERHRSLWTRKALRALGSIITLNCEDANWLAVFAKDACIRRQLIAHSQLNSRWRKAIGLILPLSFRRSFGLQLARCRRVLGKG